MGDRETIDVDPATLHVPGSRRDGDDPFKLHRHVARHGNSVEGMPPLDLKRGSDGELAIYDGVTRATRAAKYLPGSVCHGSMDYPEVSPGEAFPTGYPPE